MSKLNSSARYPAEQVVKMAKETIDRIYTWRRDNLLKGYHKWAEKQNARTFNWFGLIKLKKYPLDVNVDRPNDFDELPEVLQEYLTDKEGDFASLDESLRYAWGSLEKAERILNMASNVLNNNQVVDKYIQLTVEDYNIIRQR